MHRAFCLTLPLAAAGCVALLGDGFAVNSNSDGGAGAQGGGQAQGGSPGGNNVGGNDVGGSDTGGNNVGGSDTGGDGGGDVEELFPAHGIDVVTVEANQGVGISISNGPDAVPSSARESRLIEGRETLIRIHHEVHGDWIQREVEAQLVVTRQDQSTALYTDRRTIFADSVAGDLASSFSFILDCDQDECDAGTDFQVSLWDVGVEGSQSEGVNLSPGTGASPIGFETLNLEMRLVFIPMHYQPANTTPDLNTAWMDGISDWVYQMTPATQVTYEVRPVVDIVDPIQNGTLQTVLFATQDVFDNDFPQPNEYYIGVIDTQITPVPPFALALLGKNVNAINYDAAPLAFATNVVHEVGHNHGMEHVNCPVAQSFPDTDFPTHPVGTLETGGWGVLDGIYRAASSTYDYMSYCSPVWSSATHWSVVISDLEAENTQP